MELIRSHRDLKVWQKAIDAAMGGKEVLSMLATMSNHPEKGAYDPLTFSRSFSPCGRGLLIFMKIFRTCFLDFPLYSMKAAGRAGTELQEWDERQFGEIRGGSIGEGWVLLARNAARELKQNKNHE